MNYTKGPWDAQIFKNVIEVYESEARNGNRFSKRIVRIDLDNHHTDKEETIANAQLIAAAPDLLEALQELIENTVRFTSAFQDEQLSKAEIKAKAAIAKATGKKEVVI